MPDPFAPYLERFGLEPDGPAIETHASRLLPVLRGGRALMLKISDAPEEMRGSALMAEWGVPFCEVIAQVGPALLMERAKEMPRLEDLPDLEGMAVLCDVAASIHKGPTPVGLEPITSRFSALFEGGREGFLGIAAKTADPLLTAEERAPLHGDLHHGNVLMFGGGWRAIDPKGVLGPRGFEYANMFCNPSAEVALEAFEDRVSLVAERSGLRADHLIDWVIAWCGLSAIWSVQDGEDPSGALAIGEKAFSCRG